MPTLRDALISALTLDTFNRHAEKLAMANVAQLINNLHCLFLSREDQFVATPNFHVFEMYAAHQGGESQRTIFSAPRISYSGRAGSITLWGLAGSASLHGKQLVLTVVNPHVSEPRESEVVVRGAAVRFCHAKILTANDIHAHNTFASPTNVAPNEAEVGLKSQPFVFRFPPASVTRLDLALE